MVLMDVGKVTLPTIASRARTPPLVVASVDDTMTEQVDPRPGKTPRSCLVGG
jgi:hypothetical protein